MGNQPTPLRKAIRWSDTAQVEKLLNKAGNDASRLINNDHSPDCIMDSCSRVAGNAFYYAVSKNRITIIKMMLEKGGDPYATGPCEETCLHCAARNNFMAVARILVECGVDIKTTDDRGRFPHHSAGMTFFDTSQIIKYLLEEAGTRDDVNLRDFRQRTPLHDAALYGNTAVIGTLLGYGADVNAVDNDGNTPLHNAMKQPGVWKLLVDKGADETAKNNRGLTPNEMPHGSR